MPAAEAGKLVTFGIVPTAPETGYGYIKAAPAKACARSSASSKNPTRRPRRPISPTAATTGTAAMFAFRASRYLAELQANRPEMVAAARAALAGAKPDVDFLRLDKAAFSASPSDSIDYAVMERTKDAAVLPIDVGWNDVGSWSALWSVVEQDGGGNAHRGDVLARDCRGTLAIGDKRLIALIGLQDTVVIDTDDAVLVAHKDRVQDVKEIVSALKQQKRPQATWHRKVYRPWGSYDGIDSGDALPGQANYRQTRRCAEPAEAPPPRRALDRGEGHRAGHLRRQGVPAVGKPEHLHPAGQQAPAREPGQAAARADRGAVRRLPWRGRHRPVRRRLRKECRMIGGETQGRGLASSPGLCRPAAGDGLRAQVRHGRLRHLQRRVQALRAAATPPAKPRPRISPQRPS
jgi:hypothetical protein